MLYASSATQLRRLGIGSTDNILKVAGGIPTWSNEAYLLRLSLNGLISWFAGEAITGSAYQAGRNADATNRYQINVPPGASLEYSINDVTQILHNTTTFNISFGAAPFIEAGTTNFRIYGVPGQADSAYSFTPTRATGNGGQTFYIETGANLSNYHFNIASDAAIADIYKSAAAVLTILTNNQNLVLNPGTANIVFKANNALGAATADIVKLASTDIVPGDARLAIQSEVGSPVYIGNNTIRVVLGAAASAEAVHINASNDLIKIASSRRYKEAIEPLRMESNIIHNLSPKNFTWNKKTLTPGVHDYGLIAEEVFDVHPSLATLDAEGRPSSVQWNRLTVLMLAEIQKHEEAIRALKEKVYAA